MHATNFSSGGTNMQDGVNLSKLDQHQGVFQVKKASGLCRQTGLDTRLTCDCLKTSLAMASRFPRSLMEETYSETAFITTSQGGSTS